MVCPYCGEEQTDPLEAEDESGEYECVECERTFRYYRHITIEYSSMKIEAEEESDECVSVECINKFRYDKCTTIEYSTMKMDD